MNKKSIDAAVAKLAQQQHGLIGRDQALELGMSRAAIQRRRAGGQWQTICRDVYRLAGTTASDLQRLLAACLSFGPQAFASHATAAHLWGLDGFTRALPRILEVSVPHGHARPMKGLTVHQRRDLVIEDPARFGSIPATPLARTLVDLAAVVDAAALERAFDSAWRKSAELPATLKKCLDALGVGGRPGAHLLTGLLSARAPRPTESALEVDVMRAIRRARLPEPTRQHEIRDARGMIARVDFAWVDQRVVLFADGWAFHNDQIVFHHDREQRERLAANGWTPVVVTHRLLKKGSWLASLTRHLKASAA